jgi:hypothetical protein
MKETMKTVFDWSAAGMLVASIVELLPAIAAGMAVVWWGYRIYESHLQVRILKKQLKE